MTEASARVRFELESRAENVSLIRSGLAALAAVTGIGDVLLIDIKTAVSEACNNVVVHAYGSGTGPLIATFEVTADTFEVSIRDRGCGITQIGRHAEGHMGLGLGVMSALASRFEVISPEHGTEIRMCFSRSDGFSSAGPAFGGQWLVNSPLSLSGDAVVWLQPSSLLAPVIGRVLRAYAAASRFTADRADQLPEVGAVLSEYAERAGDGNAVGVAVSASSRRLALVSGPYPNAANGPTSVPARLAELVEELNVAEIDGQSAISFTLRDHSSP